MSTLINILGAERTGSTMLDVMIGNGQDCFSVGEIAFWYRPMRDHDFKLNCSCKKENCEFWQERKKVKEKNIFNLLLKENRVVVDSSKSLVWVIDNFDYLNKKHEVFNIVIWKDPISVAYSHFKRGEDIIEFHEKFITYYQNIIDLKIPFTSISYDQLYKDSSSVIKRICKTHGITYTEGQERFWENSAHHFLHGSHSVREQMGKKSTFYNEKKENKDFLNFIKTHKHLLENEKTLKTIEQLESRSIMEVEPERFLETPQKPLWYYVKKIGRALKRYFPEKFLIAELGENYIKKQNTTV